MGNVYKKDFGGWIEKKKAIEENHPVLFQEREVWWCSLGVNVGSEEDGKNEHFERPILILKKYSNNSFFAAPLSSKVKEGTYYARITFGNVAATVLLTQCRSMSPKRLDRRVVTLTKSVFKRVWEKFLALHRI